MGFPVPAGPWEDNGLAGGEVGPFQDGLLFELCSAATHPASRIPNLTGQYT